MCGLAGYIDFSRSSSVDSLVQMSRAMSAAIAHRGPDGSGVWANAELGVTLSHRRLSIIDLSDAGKQPMSTPDGGLHITYNGEIYNYRELRDRLQAEGYLFESASDTEVVLNAIHCWGIEKALQSFNGMFAFAVADLGNRTLYLARDRVGEKPLFYSRTETEFFFASEVRAIKSHPKFEAQLDTRSLADYLRFGYLRGERSIYRNVYKLLPGHWLKINLSNSEQISGSVPYFSIRKIIEEGNHNEEVNTVSLIDNLEKLIEDSVRLQMVSDVPLGAFLSGGIDSSLVVAMMQRMCTSHVKTFSIGFDDARYNEAPFAKAIANHLRTDHTEFVVKPHDLIDVVKSMGAVYDEPFADVSAVPTILLSKLTKQSITVALSGDGGDELFLGYKRYQLTKDIERISRWTNPFFIKVLVSTMNLVPKVLLNSLSTSAMKKYGREGDFKRKLNKLAENLAIPGSFERYLQCIMVWNTLPIRSELFDKSSLDRMSSSANPDFTIQQKMSLFDMSYYLPDDIFTKVDRASMAFGLEVRVPLVDHRIVSKAFSMAESDRYKDGIGKWPLKQILKKYVPSDLFNRPKLGLGVPISSWLRGDLREWAEDLLQPVFKNQCRYLDKDILKETWLDHQSGKKDHAEKIWSVLMFKVWEDHND